VPAVGPSRRWAAFAGRLLNAETWEGFRAERSEPKDVVPPKILNLIRADVQRYRDYSPDTRLLKLLIENQGLWAVIEYRIGHWAKRGCEPRAGMRFLRVLAALSHKAIEITTGISIAHGARIGAGLYVGHFGTIIVGGGVTMGERCNIGQGVTVGVDGEGELRGSPVIGDDVHIAPGAKVFGRITVGSGTKIGANAVVNRDLPSSVVAVGVPARPVRKLE
jgi:serine O-acetyltransferase